MSGRSFQRTTSSSSNTVDYVFDFIASIHADNAVFTLPFLGDRATIGPNLRANGLKDGEALVDALAMHPSTQRFVCGKLIEYLVSDDRPQAFVDLCRAQWAASGGNIKTILEAILTHPDYVGVAAYQRSKLKTPYEYAVGILRNFPFAFSTAAADRPRGALKSFREIWLNAGMDIFNYPVPTGFKETAADWNNSGSLTARLAAGTDKINGSRWPNDHAVQNFAGLLTSAPQPMLTAEAAAAYLLALGTADRFDRDEFDAVVAALKGSDGLFDPTVIKDGKSAEEGAVRKAISLILTLPSYQIQ
jgi:large repetitive protein